MAKVRSLRDRRATAMVINLATVAAFTATLVITGTPLRWVVLFAVVGVFGSYMALLLDAVFARLRFKRLLRRGRLECWIRWHEPKEGSRRVGWERGLVSLRTPAVDFVRTDAIRPSQERLFTFLVSGRAEPNLWDPHPNNARFLGRGARSIQLETTLGVMDVAGFPEAMEQVEEMLSTFEPAR
ncbi:hypothetical protein SAMN04487917_10677 [Arthrobacter sp. yr096]|uniref:hypothetical protein n=1 Tax=Arthrobacter sp. yr096 TaxID=1761750 RepID=UPI0008D5F254|nr:hypothetical protein [Arthrobacter sp. yr096]SEJ47006.1 hypothetical protein SAMN04487917_10677 [Arthrobacter sp. yr096]